jgi:copper ion binding protein
MRENVTLGASLLGAITASLCCIGPLAATLLGIGSFSAATLFEAWRPYLLGITSVLLAAAFYFTYRKREVACADGTCKVGSAPRWNKVLLWIATVVVILFAAFPYYSGPLLAALNRGPNQHKAGAVQVISPHEEQAATSKLATATISVEGMTCGGCVASVRQALLKREGVKSADVSLEKKQAIVKYDPAKVTPEQLVEAINQTGYKAKL